MLQTRSVHSPMDPARDGLRVLATRILGRGLPKDRYDVWMPNLGPSQELLESYRSGGMTWAVFKRRYEAELFEGGPVDERNRTVKNHGQKFTLRLLKALADRGNVTLMCHCAEDAEHCHRYLLKAAIERK